MLLIASHHCKSLPREDCWHYRPSIYLFFQPYPVGDGTYAVSDSTEHICNDKQVLNNSVQQPEHFASARNLHLEIAGAGNNCRYQTPHAGSKSFWCSISTAETREEPQEVQRMLRSVQTIVSGHHEVLAWPETLLCKVLYKHTTREAAHAPKLLECL